MSSTVNELDLSRTTLGVVANGTTIQDGRLAQTDSLVVGVWEQYLKDHCDVTKNCDLDKAKIFFIGDKPSNKTHGDITEALVKHYKNETGNNLLLTEREALPSELCVLQEGLFPNEGPAAFGSWDDIELNLAHRRVLKGLSVISNLRLQFNEDLQILVSTHKKEAVTFLAENGISTEGEGGGILTEFEAHNKFLRDVGIKIASLEQNEISNETMGSEILTELEVSDKFLELISRHASEKDAFTDRVNKVKNKEEGLVVEKDRLMKLRDDCLINKVKLSASEMNPDHKIFICASRLHFVREGHNIMNHFRDFPCVVMQRKLNEENNSINI